MRGLNSKENLKNLKFQRTETSKIDKEVIKWLHNVHAKNIAISNVMLQEKAGEVGQTIGLETFKTLNEWFEKFRTQHIISFKSICSEEKSMNSKDVEN